MGNSKFLSVNIDAILMIAALAGPLASCDQEASGSGKHDISAAKEATAAGTTPAPVVESPTCAATPPIDAAVDCSSVGIHLDAQFSGPYRCEYIGKENGAYYFEIPEDVVGGSPFGRGFGSAAAVPGDSEHLLLASFYVSNLEGLAADERQAKLYQASLARDADCHIRGFVTRRATFVANQSPTNRESIGIAFVRDVFVLLDSDNAPPSDMFLQVRPGPKEAQVSRIRLGVVPQLGGIRLFVVPGGTLGEGRLKAVMFEGPLWQQRFLWDLQLEKSPNGQFSVSMDKQFAFPKEYDTRFLQYIRRGSPGVDRDSLMVSRGGPNTLNRREVALLDVDDSGNPVVDSARTFFTLERNTQPVSDYSIGSFLDPLSGDLVIVTSNGIILVHGFSRLL